MLLVSYNVQQRGHEHAEASVLLGIEDEFDVIDVARTGPEQVKIIIEMRSVEAPCPACGVITARVKDRPLRRIKDLPASGQSVELWWRKCRLSCAEHLQH